MEATWQSSHGYTTYFQKRPKKEAGVAMSVRQEILWRHNIDITVNEKHFMKISLGSGEEKMVIAVVCVPPEGSRHYDPMKIKSYLEQGGSADVISSAARRRISSRSRASRAGARGRRQESGRC